MPLDTAAEVSVYNFERSLRNTAQRQPMNFDDLLRTSGSQGGSNIKAVLLEITRLYVSNSETSCCYNVMMNQALILWNSGGL